MKKTGKLKIFKPQQHLVLIVIPIDNKNNLTNYGIEIPEGYKIHKSAPNGILLSNGESYIGLYEAPRNNTFNQLVKNMIVLLIF